ncbi:alkaline phosphatase [Rhodohalobacter barkolensis]|uniref:Alkaline phosphatase n=1 Tax=Rhodohalobacter barkolensis TaxID=2053187 RepID=A0A2N0VEM3_9BACT|nr:alkaline phosphatase [Rhodohalobacter barkolensis]PKD42637.1 alkaline phosphatase [Rhodohalobacter barkolensis]
MSKKGFSRLEFLKAGAMSTAALGTGALGRTFQKPDTKKSSFGDAKNVIFLVVDGMSAGTLALADLLKQRQYGEKTNWIKLYESDREYHRGLMDMASLNSVVTGSAAAASSWGSGNRINNGALNTGPKGEEYKTICEIFRDAGKATGLVTSARITHATPSGFGINMPSRGQEDEIAEQYAERGYDLLMGGGARHFSADSRDDGKDLYSVFEQNGYTVARSKTEMNRATRNSKLLGLFYDSHLPYMVDHNTLPELQERVPTLAEMTKTALDRLNRNQDGFILQVEGGRVDHAAHGNDPAGLIYDQIAFDDTIKEVMDFTDGRDDTLVILTTDHGNANPGLSGLGSGYGDSPAMLDTIQDYRHSFEWMYSEMGYHWSDDSLKGVTVKDIMDHVEYAMNTKITREQGLMLKQAFQGTFRSPFQNRQQPSGVLSGVLANYNGINFISTSHTADYVEIAAWGPGSDRIPTFVRNTALFDLMVDMADVRAYAAG